jgi:hypothetical protein
MDEWKASNEPTLPTHKFLMAVSTMSYEVTNGSWSNIIFKRSHGSSKQLPLMESINSHLITDFITLIIFFKEQKLWSSSLCCLLHLSVNLLSLWSKYSYHFVLKHSQSITPNSEHVKTHKTTFMFLSRLCKKERQNTSFVKSITC